MFNVMSCLEAITQHSVPIFPTTPGVQTAFSPLHVWSFSPPDDCKAGWDTAISGISPSYYL